MIIVNSVILDKRKPKAAHTIVMVTHAPVRRVELVKAIANGEPGAVVKALARLVQVAQQFAHMRIAHL
jgi:hypothetical protein